MFNGIMSMSIFVFSPIAAEVWIWSTWDHPKRGRAGPQDAATCFDLCQHVTKDVTIHRMGIENTDYNLISSGFDL